MASLEDLLHSPLRPFLPFSGEKFLGEFFGVPWELVLQGEYIAGFFESVYFPWTFSRAEVHLKGFTLPWKNPDISLKKNIHERNMTLGSKFQCSGHFFSSPMLRLNVGLFGISGAGFQWLQDATSWFINGSEVIPSLKLTYIHRKGRRILHPEWVSEVRIKTGRQKITKKWYVKTCIDSG